VRCWPTLPCLVSVILGQNAEVVVSLATVAEASHGRLRRPLTSLGVKT